MASLSSELPVSYRSVLQFPLYRRYLLLFLFCFAAYYERSSFLSGYGAAYFGGCKSIKENNDCSKAFNYDQYNEYFQLTLSAEAVIAFICAPIIGNLSDRFGRKPFLIFQLFICSLPYIAMICVNNMKIFMILFALQGLNGSTALTTPVSLAFIADILPTHLHFIGFALLYLLSGAGLLIGEIIGFVVSSLLSDHFNFYIIAFLYFLCILYLFFVISEPQKNDEKNEKSKTQSVNPLHSLRYCCLDKIVFWCSLLMATVTLPCFGLIDIATVVIADIFNADSSQKYNEIAFFYIIGWALGLMIGPILILPILQKYFSHFYIFVITVCILLIAIAIFMIICSLFRVSWIVSFASFILGIGFLCYSALNSIVTKHTNKDEKGRVFGAIYAMQSIANCVAPITFAQIYHILKKLHLQTLVFAVCFVLLLFALLFSVGLKREIDRIENDQKLTLIHQKIKRINI